MREYELFKNYPDLLKPEELETILRLSHNTIRKLLISGTIHSVKIGKVYRIPKSTLITYLEGDNIMNHYMLISVVNREITTLEFSTLEEAQEKMRQQMMDWCYNISREQLYNSDRTPKLQNGIDYEFEINEKSAWVNNHDNEYDWLIVEI